MWRRGKQLQKPKQIPCEDDNKKGKGIGFGGLVDCGCGGVDTESSACVSLRKMWTYFN